MADNAQRAFQSGFGPNMVPVTRPGGAHVAQIEDSAMGKAPGILGNDGQWYPVAVNRWKCVTRDQAAQWDAWGANIGIALGRGTGLIAIDSDIDDVEAAQCVTTILRKYFGIYRYVTGPGQVRSLYPVRVSSPVKGTTLKFTKDGVTSKIDILAEGKQFVGFGIHARTLGQYAWSVDPFGSDEGVTQFPEITLDALKAIIAEIITALAALGWVHDGPGVSSGASGGVSTVRTSTEFELVRWLALLPNTDTDPQFDDRDRMWIGMCAAIKGASENVDWGRELWLQWCDQRSQKPGAPEHAWDTMPLEDVRSGLDWIRERARERNPKLAAQLDFELAPPIDEATIEEIAADANGAKLWDVYLPRYVWVATQDEFFDLRTGSTFTCRGIDGLLGKYATRLSNEAFPNRGKKPPYTKFSEMFFLLPDALHAEGYTYWPGQPRVVTIRGKALINRWRAPAFTVTDVKPDDVRPWLDHVEMVCGDKVTADTIIKYFALIVKRPDVKPNFAPLIMSQPGLGKDLMIVPVQVGCGENNHRAVTADNLSNQWTDFLERRFLYVSETRQHSRGSKSSHDVMNDLKAYLADQPPMVGVVRKGKDTYEVPNLTAWIFFSNEIHPMFVGENDRRIWVNDSRAVPVKPTAYYEDFSIWLERNKHLVASYLRDYPLTAKDIAFFRGRAPDTSAKAMLVSMNRDPTLAAVEELIEEAKTGAGRLGMVTTALDVKTELRALHGPTPSDIVISRVLRQCGAQPIVPIPGVGAGVVKCSDGKPRRLWLLADKDDAGNDYSVLTRPELARVYLDRKWPAAVKTTATGTVLRDVSGDTPDDPV